MTIKIYCTLCGEEIPEQAEDEGWDEWTITLKKTPWGNPHTTLDRAIDLHEVCDACAKRIRTVVEAEIQEIKEKKGNPR